MGSKSEIEDTIIRNCVLENCLEKAVQNVSSTATQIPNQGLTTLSSTGAVTIVMGAPVAGARKRLLKSSTSTAVLTVTGPTTTVLFNAAGNTNAAFDAADDFLELEGISATRWLVRVNTSVTLS